MNNKTRHPYSAGRQDWKRRAEAAEMTVEVLARKVRSLYDRSEGSTVFKQLAKQRERSQMVALRATELEQYSSKLEAEVEERTRAIQLILDNVLFGFLIVGQDLAIREGFTRSCDELFGRELKAGDNLTEILGIAGTLLGAHLTLGVDQVFDDFMDESVTLGQLPRRFPLDDRVLYIEARVIRDPQGHVNGLLMTVNDRTELESAEAKDREHRLLQHILVERPAFERFVVETRQALEACRVQPKNTPLARRVVHTIKGNAASFGIDQLVEAAHEIESRPTLEVKDLDKLELVLRGFLEAHVRLLGIQFEQLHKATYTITDKQLAELQRLAARGTQADLSRWINTIAMRPASEVMGPIPTFISSLSNRLGKAVDFVLLGADLRLEAQRLASVFDVFPHLIRNAIDHGIEPPDERGDKAPRGTITLRVWQEHDHLVLTLHDDGRGVDTDKLVQRALESGMIDLEQASTLSQADKLALVWEDRLSSADTCTETSGFGVGMTAVKVAVEELGGSVTIESQKHIGTQISIRVPNATAT